MTLNSEMRSKSATDLRTPKRSHEYRRKTIYCKSPILSSKSSDSHRTSKVSFSPDYLEPWDPASNSDPRKYYSLPHTYRQRRRPYHPVQRHTSLAHPEDVQHRPKPGHVDPIEFKRRLEVIKSWMSDFSDTQLTLLISGIFPSLGSSQLHFLSSQLPDQNPGLHHLCPSGCSDPFSLLPLHITYKILRLLPPVDLATAGKVCSTWRHHSLAPSLWQTQCERPPWRLSKEGCVAQLERWRGGSTDWRQVFVERFKLRRAWMGGQCHVRTFEGHTGGISCVQFDGSRIVSGSHDKTIKVWNVKTNSPWSVMTLAGHSGEVRCMHLEGNRLVSGSTDLTIKVWDLSISVNWSSIACRVTMVGHTDTVRCVQMDQDRDRVISGSYDTTLKVWELKTGICIKTLRGHSAPVLAIQAQGNRLISGSGDKTIRIWHLDTGYCATVLAGHNDAVTCLTLDREEQRIVSGSLDRTIKVWSIATLECLNTLDWMSNEGHTGVVRCLQADEWRILSAADDKMIKVWNLETGQRLVTLKSHSDGVTCLQFNDFYIVSGSYDKTVKLWDFTVC